jgi:hypothetical protein
MKPGVANHELSFFQEKLGKKLDKTLTTFTINYSIVFVICQNISFKPSIHSRITPVYLKKTKDNKVFSPGGGFLHVSSW